MCADLGRRLVGQQEARVPSQCDGKVGARRLTPGQGRGSGMCTFCELHCLEQAEEFVVGDPGGAEGRASRRLSRTSRCSTSPLRLGEHTDQLPAQSRLAGGSLVAEPSAGDLDGSAVWVVEAGEHVEQGRLARS